MFGLFTVQQHCRPPYAALRKWMRSTVASVVLFCLLVPLSTWMELHCTKASVLCGSLSSIRFTLHPGRLLQQCKADLWVLFLLIWSLDLVTTLPTSFSRRFLISHFIINLRTGLPHDATNPVILSIWLSACACVYQDTREDIYNLGQQSNTCLVVKNMDPIAIINSLNYIHTNSDYFLL